MKVLKIFMLLSLLSCTGLFLTSCEEEAENAVDGVGDNFVRLPDAAEDAVVVAMEASPGVVTINLAEILRDANSEKALNQAVSVTLQLDQSVIAAYNAAHGTSWEQLPGTLYQADPLDVNFAAGDFSKFFTIKLDPTKLDLSKKYALGITIAGANNGYKVRNGLSSAMYTFVIKNKYDGTYRATGVFHHPTAGDRDIARDKTLATVNANTVITELGDLGGSGYQMLLTVNADNTVTIAPSGVTPNIDQSWGDNYYNPATKTFHLHYSYNVAAPRVIEEAIKRK